MSDILNGLNPQQKEAVMHTTGPLLILAGAGSGKTRVLTHRIAYLIETGVANPENILALTFTNKAAKEMKERVSSLTGAAAKKMLVTTFHSACVKFLKNRMTLLGYKRKNFVIYDTSEQKKVIKQAFDTLNFRENYREIKESDVLNFISKQKETMTYPEDLEKQGYGGHPYTLAYKEYEKILKKNNALDFDDLLCKTIQLFEAYPRILESYQERFKFIMVDEYQDTNLVQFKIVSMLAEKYQNLCVVGDDDQSIYRFRGADIRNILEFEKKFKNTKVIKLEENYRSTKNILSAANAVIAHNTNRKTKRLWTQGNEGAKIRTITLADATREAQYIVSEIEQAHERQNVFYKDFAILYRTNAQSRLFEQYLAIKNIPYRLVGALSFFERKEIKDMLAYLRVLVNHEDDFGLERIINVPRRGIGATTVKKLQQYAAKKNCSLYEAVCSADEILSGAAAKKIRAFAAQIQDLTSAVEELSAEKAIKFVLETTNYFSDYEKNSEELEERMGNVYELINMAVSYTERAEQEEGSMAIEGFLTESALLSGIDSVDDHEDCVVLMTLHSAKGLEFPYVYIAGMEEDTFPSYRALESSADPSDLEEERRLCYVGITRTRKVLTLTSAAERMVYGQTYPKSPSRFLSEIPPELINHKVPRW